MTHGPVPVEDGVSSPAFGAVLSVTEATQRGMSQLTSMVRAGRDVLIVKNSRAEAALIAISKYDKLSKFDAADRCATYVLGLARYLAQHRTAQTFADVMNVGQNNLLDAFTPAGKLKIVDVAVAEFQNAAFHEQTMLMVLMREVATSPEAGVACGPDEVPSVRSITLGQWDVSFATAPEWNESYVLEVARKGVRDCFERMNEAAALLAGTLSRYSTFHKPNEDETRLSTAPLTDEPSALVHVQPRARAPWGDIGDGGL